MANVLTPPPTEAEAAYIASLAASAPAPMSIVPSMQLKTELQDFFRLCRIPWVADFLFNQDMNSLPALTAPANMRSAISCSVQMNNVQSVAFGDRPFDLHLSAGCVFVPSFSVGEISVGFGVQECFTQCYNDWCGRPGLFDDPSHNHIRYVRDDARGVFICVYKDARVDLLKMEAMVQTNASVRRRTFAVFDHSQFRNVIRTERGILHPENVLPTMKLMCSVVESRRCPHCGSPANFFCDCQIQAEIPKHPLDFSALGKNMMAYVGTYEGLSRSAVYEDGVETLSANVGTVVSIEGGVDDDLISRLSRWAIEDQLKDRKESPVALIMPASAEDKREDDVQVIDMPMDQDEAMDETALPLPEVSNSFFDPLLNVTSSCSSGSGILIRDSLEDTGPQVVPQEKDTLPSQLFGNTSTLRDPSSVEDEALELVKNITNDIDMGEQFFETGKSLEPISESVSSDGQDVPSMDVPTDVFESQAHSKNVSTWATTIAPSAPLTDSREREQDERERRAQLRKQRNREAAQRSNLKRKIKNDTLKQALKESHAKAAELRAKELALREENLQLRKLTLS